MIALVWGAVSLDGRAAAFDVQADADAITVASEGYRMTIEREGFRFGFTTPDGAAIAPPHAATGLVFLGDEASSTGDPRRSGDRVTLTVTNRQGRRADVHLEPHPTHLRMAVIPRIDGDPADEAARPVIARTGGVSPAFGLGDHGGYRRPPPSPLSTQLVPFVDEHLRASHGDATRLVSNLVIFPRQRLAAVNIDPGIKIVRLTEAENAHGSYGHQGIRALVWFFGEPKTIYADFLRVRNEHGYAVYPPKYTFFGVGWEAWGALEWETNQQSVMENVGRYLDLGYPLSWMVIGSGFWPRHDARYHATTSFGMWDEPLYPDPRAMIRHFHERGLKVIIGLRIAFITDGPFAAEGVRKGHFMTADGEPRVFEIGFPRSPVYLLDASRPEAVAWYVSLCEKWLDAGIDGFKEDLYGYGRYDLPDDKLDPVNAALMERGVYVMGRNGYLGSPMDLHRFEDFNFDHDQDRGPINGLSFAYSGLPNVYPDVVGGKPGAGGLKDRITSDRARRYLMRQTWYAALHPSMAFGIGTWRTGDDEVVRITREAARLHARLQPYIYSAAMDAVRTGYPYPMTPLPVAFPDDPEVYRLENAERRGYQWLVGESLMAAPLYGNDYATAETRDVYLPAGTWMEYDTGRIHEGPTTLHAFAMPVDRTPLFVGGRGMVLEQAPAGEQSPPDDAAPEAGPRHDGPALYGVVYPIAPPGASATFTCPDGRSKVTMTHHVTDWHASRITVRDHGGAPVSFDRRDPTGAVVFPVEPDRRYEIRTGN